MIILLIANVFSRGIEWQKTAENYSAKTETNEQPAWIGLLIIQELEKL